MKNNMKSCTKCQKEKPLELFHKNPRCRDGRASWCKSCVHAQLIAARQSPEAKARFKTYQRRAALRKRYGIDDRHYDVMLAAQHGGCMICGKQHATLTGKQRRLHVDHGPYGIRGLLCCGCNRGLGLFSHDAKLLKRAAVYMEKFDAQGQRERQNPYRDERV